jgi:hypothetical protein
MTGKHQTPNTKLPAPEKHPASTLKRLHHTVLRLDALCFSGVWSLSVGVFT